jgi:hypothetical protein
MKMENSLGAKNVTQAKTAIVAGFAICLASLCLGQIAIGSWLAPEIASDIGFAQDIGYTFTGLTAALGFLMWKWGKAREPEKPTKYRFWAVNAMQATLASLPVLFGGIYFSVAGKEAERHARTFAALPPVMYLMVVVARKKKHRQSA